MRRKVLLSLLAGMVVLLAGSARIVQANTAATGGGMTHAMSKAGGKMPSPQEMLAMKRALPAMRAAAAQKAAAQGLKVSTKTAPVTIKGKNKNTVSPNAQAATGLTPAAAGGSPRRSAHPTTSGRRRTMRTARCRSSTRSRAR